ncbi:hypothetical protein [Rhizobium mesoamericanum]|uniref:hypothetical protein n=1 Tax=Rhizobium mesoamericanum TaxID=1079800 RepID=UPI0027D86CF3|nr:hypothetical protein [Rhizobium mesoamericanum]
MPERSDKLWRRLSILFSNDLRQAFDVLPEASNGFGLKLDDVWWLFNAIEDRLLLIPLLSERHELGSALILLN